MAARSVHSTLDATASEAFVGLLRVAGRLLRDLDDACKEADITHDQYNVLRILRGVHPEGHPRYEIAARLVRRSPDVTRLLDRLETRGLVTRRADPENRRLSIARITADGLALLTAVDPRIDAVAATYMDGHSEADCRAVSRVCRRILE